MCVQCAWMHGHVFMSAHVCTSKWKPKVDIRSLLLSLYLFLQALSPN